MLIQTPKGYGSEAINWAVDWAFNYANVHKVEIGTASYNERAAHLYERLGFKFEGRKREVIFMNRRWYDLVEFGMLEHEWAELRGKKPAGGIPELLDENLLASKPGFMATHSSGCIGNFQKSSVRSYDPRY